MSRKIVFLWENIGPTHKDRLSAVSKHVRGQHEVHVIELHGKSDTYEWDNVDLENSIRHTLFVEQDRAGVLRYVFALLKTILKIGRGAYFFCHYEKSYILLIACTLRIMGSSVFVMNDSKMDDKQRYLGKEILKYLFLLPYMGALSCIGRSESYFKFFGFKRIFTHYDAVSVERLQTQSREVGESSNIPYEQRYFICIARLVEKKNLKTLIDAFDIYARSSPEGRRLYICGSGPLEDEIRNYITIKNLNDRVIITGFIQTEAISKMLSGSLSLILASTEEQFGYAIAEACAMGIPVIVSENCGARDAIVKTGVNGFIFEPDNARGLAFFMKLICQDPALWESMSTEARLAADGIDVANFASGVKALVSR